MKRLKMIKAALALNVLALASLPTETQAIPYASSVNQSGTAVSFILNEDADEVKVVLQNPANTLTLSTAKGQKNFNLSSPTQTYSIEVTKSTTPSWTQISQDTNTFNKYYAPAGLAVFNDPSDLPRFGRIYVSEATGGVNTTVTTPTQRTVAHGIYVVNSDFTDALGQGDNPLTAGITFDSTGTSTTSTGTRSPWKIEIGQDKKLYIADWSTSVGTVWQTDADVTTSVQILDGLGLANPTVHTTINGSPIAKGSLAGNNLQLWAINGQTTGPGGGNRLVRWDVNGTAPHNSAPAALLGTAGNSSTSDVNSDLDIAPDGKFFVTQARDLGSNNVYDANRVNLRVYDTDGTTLLWDSLQQSLNAGLAVDFIRLARGVKVSPDGKKVAVIIWNTKTWIMDLTNGVPDITTRVLVNTDAGLASTSTASPHRDVTWDIAGNLYTCNASMEYVRAFSPGGTTKAVTTSAGTFSISTPQTSVAVSASPASINEGGTATYTVTRTGDTSGTLAVAYTMSGTAISGSDYTALAGSVTFAAGATSTNISLVSSQDTDAEATETAILTLDANPNYAISTASATVSILDDETPQIQVSALQNRLIEGYAFSRANFRFTRLGLLNTPVTVNVSYSGSATHGVDFTGNTSVSIAANASTANLTVTNLIDNLYEGNEVITANVASGTGYSIGSPASANITIVDDEHPAGTVLFADDFDSESTSSSQWTVNAVDSDSKATFGWDYLANAGIPAAPRSNGSSTLGVKLTANETAGAINGISISPSGQNFTGDYRLSFDLWCNYNGPLNGGGVGSTLAFNSGIGTTGDHANWPSGFSDGAWFSVMGDGGNGTVSGDYNAYYNFNLFNETSGVYSAGIDVTTRDHNNAYYSIWGGNPAPAAQLALPIGVSQTNNTFVGTIGIAWHTVTITKKGEVVTWNIDGVTVATLTNYVDTDFEFATTGNIFVGVSDQYAGATDEDLVFAVVDNLRVETYADAPAEPPTISISRNGNNITLTWSGNATLQQASALTGSPSDWSNVNGAVSGHTVNASTGIKFYRLVQ